MQIEVTKPSLAEYQDAFLYNPERFTIVEASTKAGKTFAMLWGAFEALHDTEKPIGWEVWWVAPVFDQSKIAFNRLKRAIASFPQYRVNHSELSITAPHGRVLRFKTADKPDNLYGENVFYIIWDEFTRAKEDAFLALRSTLTHTKGKLKMIGNFKGNANWGHQMALRMQDDPEWAYFKITAWQAVEAGILDRDEVERAQKDLDPHEFKALYECEGSASPLQLMAAQAINGLWDNEAETGEKYLTVDVAGVGSDATVFMAWDGFNVTGIKKIAEYVNTDQWVRECADAAMQYASEFSVPKFNIIIDNGGMGGGVPQLITGCRKFNGAAAPFTKKEGSQYGNLRVEAFHKLAKMVNSGEIRIDTNDYRSDIVLELEAVRWKSETQEIKLYLEKKEDVKRAIGRSPDFADAMSMRMLPELQGRSIIADRFLR